MNKVHVLRHHSPNPYGGIEINTTAKGGIFKHLSPFILGPVKQFAGSEAQNLENFWQFHKVYKYHVDKEGEPTLEWYDWHHKGFADTKAHRYPMGKGAIPEYSFWNGERLGYIAARKRIYAPKYAEFVTRTESFKKLEGLYISGEVIVLRDYDAYDHIKLGMTLKDVINNPHRIMGHAFVLAMILENVLEECLE